MPEPSELRNLLAETVAASETAAAPAEREKPEAVTPAPEKPEAPSGERARGPDGKFLPKAETEETEQAPPETDEEETGEPEGPEVKEPQVEVPQHWSQADKDLIAKLPAEHRQEVVDRYKAIEAGFTPKLQRAAELEKQFGGAQELFAPYADVLRQRNQTPSDVVKAWASVEQGFLQGLQDANQGRPNEKGAQLIANLIRNYRIDPGAVAAVLQGQPIPQRQTNGEAPPPVTLPPEVIQEINASKQWRENFERQVTTERETAAQRQIDAFAQEKDASGNLVHPHFQELESDIAALAQIVRSQGKAVDLADLYDRAVHANPETRAKLLAAREAEAKQKAAADRKAKALAAQRASASVTGSSGSGQAPTEQRRGSRSLREELNAAAAEVEDAA